MELNFFSKLTPFCFGHIDPDYLQLDSLKQIFEIDFWQIYTREVLKNRSVIVFER